eukprot:TRINITY_DN6842_c0_g1_i1.p1 TRINITY_DN6842_c0_g1~~TRINITY_DN6842_c0_g1_i1.p1  ORF type:complete len:333 (-),score=46.96 TRINITY_DN6842_c0_g1_i1:179-1177(-)
MKDNKNIERGVCSKAACHCDEFLNPVSGFHCEYCYCPAGQHAATNAVPQPQRLPQPQPQPMTLPPPLQYLQPQPQLQAQYAQSSYSLPHQHYLPKSPMSPSPMSMPSYGAPLCGQEEEMEKKQSSTTTTAQRINLPALVRMEQYVAHEMRGPTDTSNWVIKHRVMAGAYPGSRDHTHPKYVKSLIKQCNITTFVCLQQPHELRRFKSYDAIAKAINEHTQCVNFPIVDGNIASDSEVLSFVVDDLSCRLERGEVLYIHCYGGHGRTGTVVALLLSYLYNLTANEALKLTQLYHTCRRHKGHNSSPEMQAQIDQVRRLAPVLQKRSINNMNEK